MPDELLKCALELLSRGLSLIPIVARGKKPAIAWAEYQQRVPTMTELVDWFGSGRPLNLAIVTGRISNVVAVDCDSPEAIAWADAHLPSTEMRTRSGGGGEHRFYRHPGHTVRNKVRIHADREHLALDIRADGGYVVGPGSVHESGAVYERLGSWPPIDELPVFDPTWAPAGSEAPAGSRAGLIPDDRNHLLHRARAYVASVPPAIQGQGGDTHTFQLACKLVRGYDLDDADAVELLREWNQRCVPPWSETDLLDKIDGARKYGDEPIGGRIGAPIQAERTIANQNKNSGEAVTTLVHRKNAAGYQSGVALADFYAYMPMHGYIFAPSREVWPAASVNGRLPRVPLVDKDGYPVLDGCGSQKTVKPSAWLDKHQPIEQMTWAPKQPMIITDRLVSDGGWVDRVGCRCFNLYRPPLGLPGYASEAGPWLEHVHRVYPGDASHIVSWLAQRVQRPHEKINHALVLGGLQGIGKDTLLEPVKTAVGPWNFIEVSPSHLIGRFNGFVKSVILRVSEARDLGDLDRYAFYDHTKIYTAAPPDVLRVDEKNLREYVVWNVCGVILTTNHKFDGLYLPADDRRHYVAWSPRTKEDFEPDYWTALYHWYTNGGNSHVSAYLAELDLTNLDPKAPPPKTAAFWDMVDANRAPEDAELADALDTLGRPDVTTLAEIVPAAAPSFGEWLRDRKNGRRIPHRFEIAGYVAVRNPDAKDGLWRFDGRRQVIYAQQELSLRDQIAAARYLIGGNQ